MSGQGERAGVEFSGRVGEYARFRAGYPGAEVVEFLREACGWEPSWRVVDVGAGTGMLTEVLLREGNRVTAVEPNPEMRAVCEGLREEWPELRVVDGTAERTGLEEGSAELLTAGRAFHWFEPAGAAREFRRVVRPGGWVALLTNGPVKDGSEQAREMERMQRAHQTREGYVESRAARVRAMGEFLRGLGGGELRQTELVTKRRLGWEAFAGFLQSLSCTPMEGEDGYGEMRRAAEAFFARWSVDGALVLREVCYVTVGRVAAA